MSIGFIKLHRKIIEWEWYSDVNVCRVFLHLLLTANFENKKWQGIDISRGQVITSLEKLGKSTTLTIQQVRTALNKLKSTHEITIKATKLHTFITLTNYNLYQDIIIESNTPNNTPDNNSSTNDQQRINKEATTTKEGKEEKEIKEGEEKKPKKTKIKPEITQSVIEDQFESFWNLYGKKLSRPDAEKKFKAALKKDTFENIIAGLEKYIKARGADTQYWKHPSTWLHNECWKDDYTQGKSNGSGFTPTQWSKY